MTKNNNQPCLAKKQLEHHDRRGRHRTLITCSPNAGNRRREIGDRDLEEDVVDRVVSKQIVGRIVRDGRIDRPERGDRKANGPYAIGLADGDRPRAIDQRRERQLGVNADAGGEGHCVSKRIS
jgi:hypothetical protein